MEILRVVSDFQPNFNLETIETSLSEVRFLGIKARLNCEIDVTYDIGYLTFLVVHLTVAVEFI